MEEYLDPNATSVLYRNNNVGMLHSRSAKINLPLIALVTKMLKKAPLSENSKTRKPFAWKR